MERTCENCKHIHLKPEEYPCVECSHRYVDKFEPATNFDRVHFMDVDELAEFMCNSHECNSCPGAELCTSEDGKATGLKKWLRAIAKE